VGHPMHLYCDAAFHLVASCCIAGRQQGPRSHCSPCCRPAPAPCCGMQGSTCCQCCCLSTCCQALCQRLQRQPLCRDCCPGLSKGRPLISCAKVEQREHGSLRCISHTACVAAFPLVLFQELQLLVVNSRACKVTLAAGAASCWLVPASQLLLLLLLLLWSLPERNAQCDGCKMPLHPHVAQHQHCPTTRRCAHGICCPDRQHYAL
jgi:hypothetical protein